VQPHTGLSFGDMPGADLLAFRSAHTDLRVNPDDAVWLGKSGTEGAEFGAGRIAAMHTAPGDVDFKIFAFEPAFSGLDEQPIIRGEAMVYFPFFRCGPVGDFHPVVG